MSIDTKFKRSSVFDVPGVQMNPFPLAPIVQGDRQHISDQYAGILAQIPNFIPNETCWAPSNRNTSMWTRSGTNVSIWVNEKKRTDIWVDEREVQPCQD